MRSKPDPDWTAHRWFLHSADGTMIAAALTFHDLKEWAKDHDVVINPDGTSQRDLFRYAKAHFYFERREA
jgi:hypothetical protein